MSRKPDPRPARTRQLLFDALLQLIQEKRWDQIRVQDILDMTGVGRSTFYAHYDNKFDLLTAEIPALSLSFTEGVSEPDLLPLFRHVEEMQPVMKPIMSQPLLGEITDVFQQRLAASWSDYLASVPVPEYRRTVAAELLAGGFISVCRRWLIGGCEPSPEELCADFTAFASAVVGQAQV